MRRPTALVVLFLASLGAPSAAPQTQPPSFTAGTRTVAVYATVTNARGRLETDLSRDDFKIDDDGKRQELTLFSNDVQPITVVMLLDRSGSMKPNFDLEERAAEAFVGAMGPADKARIGSFATRIQVDPDEFTSDHGTLLKILRGDLQEDGPTPLWNAVDTGIDKLLVEQGRRVVLVFTDGDDTGSSMGMGKVLEEARNDEVMIYAIGLQSEYFNGQRQVRSKPDAGLRRLADETGGGYFELEKTSDLAPTFTRVANELHSQYLLGFSPTALDGKVHRLVVRTKRPGMTVRARRSYLASSDAPTK